MLSGGKFDLGSEVTVGDVFEIVKLDYDTAKRSSQ